MIPVRKQTVFNDARLTCQDVMYMLQIAEDL